MMHVQEDGVDGLSRTQRLEPLQLAQEKELLLLVQVTVGLRTVAVEADDRNQRGIEREIDARLVHCGPLDTAGFLPKAGSVVAKRADEPIERREPIGMRDAIVIAGNGKDRSGVLLVGVVELVVIEFRFTVIIHDVAEVEEERRLVRRRNRGRKLPKHQIRAAALLAELRLDRRARIADGMASA